MPASPSEPVDDALVVIHEHILLAVTFLGAAPVSELLVDKKTFYATMRCLEIISEASRRLGAPVRDRYPHLPWKAIMGLGNVYRHEYDNVDEIQVWRTVHTGLPPLMEAVAAEMRYRRLSEPETPT